MSFAVKTTMGVRDRIKGRDLVSWVKEQAKAHVEKTGEVHPAAFFLGSIGTREIEAMLLPENTIGDVSTGEALVAVFSGAAALYKAHTCCIVFEAWFIPHEDGDEIPPPPPYDNTPGAHRCVFVSFESKEGGTYRSEAYSAKIDGRVLGEYAACDPEGRMAHLLWEQPKESA